MRAEHREIIEINNLNVERAKTLGPLACVAEVVTILESGTPLPSLAMSYTEAKPSSVRQGVFKKISESEKGIESEEKRQKGGEKDSTMGRVRQLGVAINDRRTQELHLREGSDITEALRTQRS